MSDEIPLTEEQVAEKTAELIDTLMEADRLRLKAQGIVRILDAEKRRRLRLLQPGTLHPYPPRPPEDGQ